MFVNSYYTAMYRIYLLLFLLLGGRSHQAGSLVLTSSPMTVTDEELFTLICSRNTTRGQDRQWKRDDTVVFYTTQGSTSPTVANPDIFNRYLSGRVNVSCDATQHNVTLRINSAVDNGSRWQCVDNVASQTSNTMTIYVTVPQSTVTATPTHSASVTTPRATDITGSTDVNVSETPTSPLSKHPTTISTTTKNSTKGNPTTTSGYTAGHPTTISTTTTNNTKGNPITTSGYTAGESNTIAIAAGAAGGGVAVIAVVIVAAICIRKRRRSLEEDVRDKSRRDRNPSRSFSAEMLIESGVTEGDEKVMMDNIIYTSSCDVVPVEYSIHDHDQADKVMQDNILYTSSSDIEPANYSIEDQNHVGKDVYTQVKKVKTNADTHVVTDVYAKPHKGRQETPNGDVYAKVNKVKSREGTSENIEDMYAKPQKGKRNLKSNPDAE
ncbi:uncharacterized protein LOC124269573 isoform X2 [Haliotis rubra]|uniref:uncharacterized protein LOC124269573 isoform X2 n=1 Tax=Haliotis rubra TaxID=36100 RepID=UPI001EE58E87|nr:uncharacterized protein LOC124269573 isoform X2 [Haliotis rubra]